MLCAVFKLVGYRHDHIAIGPQLIDKPFLAEKSLECEAQELGKIGSAVWRAHEDDPFHVDENVGVDLVSICKNNCLYGNQ